MKEITRKLAFAHLKALRKLAEDGENRRKLIDSVTKRTGGNRRHVSAFVNRALRENAKDMVEPTLGAALLLEECAEEIKKGKSK